MTFVQPPIRNQSLIGASVYGHSGEFGPTVTDLRLPGRGLDLVVTRAYRSSLCERAGELGRGWSLNLVKRVEGDKDDFVFSDGSGLAHRFVRHEDGGYVSPAGFYGVIADVDGITIRFRYGNVLRFDTPADGGRLRSVEDRNGNTITFAHHPDGIEILDSLHRPVAVAITDGMVSEIHDHAGRAWAYQYDADRRLVEVRQPVTSSNPHGTTLRYEYDAAHRLTSLTDANDQRWLAVSYDPLGQVIGQHFGSGTYTFAYEELGRGRATRMNTTCRLRNGGTLIVEHNTAGNPVTRTLWVRRDAFAAVDVAGETDDMVPVVTTMSYNRHGERVQLVRPDGNSTSWDFAEDDDDARNRGNCLRRVVTPAPGRLEVQSSLVTTWTRDREFQMPETVTDERRRTTRHEYDERANRTGTAFPQVSIERIGADGTSRGADTLTPESSYTFNSRGQLLQKVHIDGTATAYDYYPVADPIGNAGPGSATGDPEAVCGYLAQVTHDATGLERRHEFRWDPYGNKVSVFDSGGNGAHRQYDAMGRLEAVVGREPFADRVDYRYDANGNEIESLQPFERLDLDETGEPATQTSVLRQLCRYDELDNLVERTIAGSGVSVTERFIRDQDARVVRIVASNGTVTELDYDERDLVVAVTRAADTRDAVTERRTYTRNGALRTITDENGNTTLYHYDGYGRYIGLSDPLGTLARLWRDEVGNVVRVAVGAADEPNKSEPGAPPQIAVPLIEAWFHYDEWDRVVRVDRAWRDIDGKDLGRSGWDGREGVVSTVVEYGANGRALRVWREGGDVATCAYDGLGQPATIEDVTGALSSYVYDANGSLVEARFRGAPRDEGAPELAVRLDYDGMDRLVSRQVATAPPERFEYNSLGAVVRHLRPSGMEVRQVHDDLGRRVGQILSADTADGGDLQPIVRRNEFDESFRLVAHIDGAGNRTSYRYDALGRQVGIVYPDDTEAIAAYDPRGNVVRTRDAEASETLISYDACGRLVERRTRKVGDDVDDVETFEYDAIGRLVRAVAPGGEVRRTHDSLSRVISEIQGDRTVKATYDSAGNAIALDYPGGTTIRRKFDSRCRVAEVESEAGEPIASVRYRAGEQVEQVVVGGVLEASCSYDDQERLKSVTYRSVADGTLVEGYTYQRDNVGRIVHEVQASDKVGQSFWFDGFGRPVRARYGVENVRDPASDFEIETTYDWFADGPWQIRRDIDSAGQIIAERHGKLNQRNRYLRFGGTSYRYDAVGNIIERSSDNPGVCLYTYDAANRLIKVECFDKNAKRTTAIEYEYDALGRLVRKIVTNRDGEVTDTTFTWAGTTLLEEYENGILVQTYVYGIGSQPARLTVTRDGRVDYLYVHDGRGLVVGLVRADDPNAFAERYGYEITGAAYVTEIDGIKVELPDRSTKASTIWNSILMGDKFGSLMHDWASGTLTGGDGRHLDATLTSLLNIDASLTGGVHTTVRTTMGKQFQSFLGMLGMGSPNGGFVSQAGPGGQTSSTKATGVTAEGAGGGSTKSGDGLGMAFMARQMALYSNDTDLQSGLGKLVDLGKGIADKAQNATSGVGGVNGVDIRPGTSGPMASPDPNQKERDQFAPKSDPRESPKQDSSTGQDAAKMAEQIREAAAKQAKEAADEAAKEAADKAAKEAADKAAKEAAEKAAKAAAEKAAKEKKEEGKKKGKEGEGSAEENPDSVYVDPDQQAALSTAVFTPEQIEMRLNGRKLPVDPHTDGAAPSVDTLSPPPSHGGADPLLDRYDGEVYGGVSLEYAEMKLSTAPIDYHQDKPEPPTPNPETGVPTTTRDVGWP